ncbi:MAG: DsbA family protein [Gammaproteobacteria bacterium]|nr:DsbA family protein [Gammaproteobacteria bacterium]
MIGFAFDYISTASLLAFAPTCALADELGVPIEWLPVPGNARLAGVGAKRGNESVSERHSRVRAEYVAMDVARYARWQGIEINRDANGVDSALACAGGLWADRHGVARNYHQQVFTEFWAGRLDIEDGATLRAVLDGLGAPGFDEEGFEAPLAAHKASVEDRGVHTLPAYLVEEQLFVGRAHLPMIRWILQGRDGPGPL